MGIGLLALVFLASGLMMVRRARAGEPSGSESGSRRIAISPTRRLILGIVMLVFAVLVGVYAVLDALT